MSTSGLPIHIILVSRELQEKQAINGAAFHLPHSSLVESGWVQQPVELISRNELASGFRR
jgi:hypothetical protein